MTERECYKLLGFGCIGSLTTATIESISSAIEESIEYSLTDSASDLADFAPIHLGATCMVLRSEDQLLFLAVDDDGCLAVSEDAKFLFRVLSAEGLLRVVADEAVVLELERLRNEVVEARLKANEDLDRSEYKRLKAKFEDNR